MGEILYDEEARDALMDGINLVANTIKCTLGPQARTVVIKQNGKPVVINDGVTIAKAIKSDDEFVQMGVELMQEVAAQAQENSGDGTTTATIMAQQLCHYGLSAVKDGENPVELKKLMDSDVRLVLEKLDGMATKIKGREELEGVATIAANNDSKLGVLIADIVEKVGRDGIISIEDGQSLDTTFDIIEGMELDSGYMSHLMINNEEGTHCEFSNCLVLMSNETINNINELLPALEISMSEKKPLLIMCKELEGTAFPNLLANVHNKIVNACAIKTPDFGDEQVEILKDIQSMIGGTVFNADLGMKISNVKLEDLGIVDKVKIGQLSTTMIHDATEQHESITARAQELLNQMEAQKNEWFKEKLHKRIGRLTGGVALIKVGGSTEIEIRETKERLDDALNATRAALQEGIVVGGGLALWNCVNDDFSNGLCSIVRSALKAPIKQLAENSGHELSYTHLSKRDGYDAKNDCYTDMWEAGILDPVKITKSALVTASSIAGLVLTTEVLVGDDFDEGEVKYFG
jgi:chaperonin GroEL